MTDPPRVPLDAPTDHWWDRCKCGASRRAHQLADSPHRRGPGCDNWIDRENPCRKFVLRTLSKLPMVDEAPVSDAVRVDESRRKKKRKHKDPFLEALKAETVIEHVNDPRSAGGEKGPQRRRVLR